jgi:hypothetical protein
MIELTYILFKPKKRMPEENNGDVETEEIFNEETE